LVVEVNGGGMLQPFGLLNDGGVDFRVAMPYADSYNAGKGLQIEDEMFGPSKCGTRGST
jgi:hypothetical protein